MKGVDDTRERRALDRSHAREAVLARGLVVEAVIPQRTTAPQQVFVQPVVVEGDVGQVLADRAEGMHVGVAAFVPVGELDAELEGAVRVAQEVVFVEAQHLVEQVDGRNGRLAHADDADLIRFHHGDREARPEYLGKRGGAHPARGAATDDHYRLDLDPGHGLLQKKHLPASLPAGVMLLRRGLA